MKNKRNQAVIAAIVTIFGATGCGQKQAAPPPPSPAATNPQNQETMNKFVQSNPGMPAAEKAAMQKQMGQGVK